MDRLKDKVALITGGTSGIGLATAKVMLDQGARVVVSGRDEARVHHATSSLGDRVRGIVADVRHPEALDRLYADIRAREGRLDVLFANAGVAKIRPVEAVDEDAYAETFDVNVRGTFFTLQKASPLLGEGASVIVNTSVANVKSVAGLSLYAASKAAARSLVRSFAREWLERGIRVNAISPGPTMTPIHGKYGVPESMLEPMAKATLDLIPLRRMASAEEIAAAVVFLASNDSTFMRGEEIAVDGGIVNL